MPGVLIRGNMVSIPLIELKNIHLKNPIKEHRCKYKTDKITYSKSYARTAYDVAKNEDFSVSLNDINALLSLLFLHFLDLLPTA